MRTMIDLGRERGPILGGGMHIMDTPTSLDCMSLREARRSSFGRSLLDCVIPTCFQPFDSNISCDSSSSGDSSTDSPTTSMQNLNYCSSSTTVTGTFFGHRKGHVSFCLQLLQQQQEDDSKSSKSRRRRRRSRTTTPVVLLLLEFGVPTSYLAREMQHGLLRIALVEQKGSRGQQRNFSSSSSIFGVPMWTMYCNGRKVGFATRREMTDSDGAVLKLMQSVSVGAGVLPSQSTSTDTDHDHEILYLRASFKRVIGSLDSESFHMINPDSDNPSHGSSSNSYTCASGQELSIFLLRSSS